MTDSVMEPETVDLAETAAASKRFVRRLFLIGENRLELLIVELQEERERLVRVILLMLGVAVFGLLAGATLTATIAVLFWKISPWATLLTLTILHGIAAGLLYRRVSMLMQNWQTLSATIDQLRKDRECLENNLL